jgi:hypothetical protein
MRENSVLQSLLETTLIETAARTAGNSLLVGQVVEVSANGRAIVDYPGNEAGPSEANSILTAEQCGDQSSLVGTPALLWIDATTGTPVILGLIHDQLVAKKPSKRQTAKSKAVEVRVDGDQLVLEAKQQIELRCGDSSITLRQDGKILIKGAELVSRASRSNRIKGASVEIN